MADARRGVDVLDAMPRLRTASELRSRISKLWKDGLRPGDKTGWPSLDMHYTVAPGMLTVVTGWPSSGKSEFLDALLVNLARQNWRIAMFSPENQPAEIHVAKFMEKLCGKPFGHGPTERISETELASLTEVVDQHFAFMDAPDGALSIRAVLETAEQHFVDAEGKRGLVIDPWNEFEHWRPQHLSETEYVSQTLSAVRHWARRNQVHVWIVAHPQKLKRTDGGALPVPSLDSISGSQHWWNKADCGIVVHRDQGKQTQDVDIFVLKCRFKHIGRQGKATLQYDRTTGRYHEGFTGFVRVVSS